MLINLASFSVVSLAIVGLIFGGAEDLFAAGRGGGDVTSTASTRRALLRFRGGGHFGGFGGGHFGGPRFAGPHFGGLGGARFGGRHFGFGG
jgi:hypothetical protein